MKREDVETLVYNLHYHYNVRNPRYEQAMYGFIIVDGDIVPPLEKLRDTFEPVLRTQLDILGDVESVVEDIDFAQSLESQIVDAMVEEIKNQLDVWVEVPIYTSDEMLFDDLGRELQKNKNVKPFYFSVFLENKNIVDSDMLFVDWQQTVTNFLSTGKALSE